MCTIICNEKVISKLIMGITKTNKLTPFKILYSLGKYISHTYILGTGQVSLGLKDTGGNIVLETAFLNMRVWLPRSSWFMVSC